MLSLRLFKLKFLLFDIVTSLILSLFEGYYNPFSPFCQQKTFLCIALPRYSGLPFTGHLHIRSQTIRLQRMSRLPLTVPIISPECFGSTACEGAFPFLLFHSTILVYSLIHFYSYRTILGTATALSSVSVAELKSWPVSTEALATFYPAASKAASNFPAHYVTSHVTIQPLSGFFSILRVCNMACYIPLHDI